LLQKSAYRWRGTAGAFFEAIHYRPLDERRLSAILAADVAGYSRLTHHDEEATHAKLTTLLARGVEPAIAEHGGRIVKNTGDGFLWRRPPARIFHFARSGQPARVS
jgi:class 3 adenylate cyclase